MHHNIHRGSGMKCLPIKCLHACLLAVCVSLSAHAQEPLFSMPDNQLPDLFELKSFQWQQLEPAITNNNGYEPSGNFNEHLLQGAVQNYLESKLTALGIPRSAVTLTGAAVIFAAGQDAMLNLNESKTMSLQFQDIRDNDRAILYRLKYSW